MAKLKGAAKTAFLKRINKGRRAAGLKAIKAKTTRTVKKAASKVRSKVKRSSSNNTKRSNGSSMARRKPTRADAMKILKKAGIGAGLGLIVRLGTMFFPQPTIRETGQRAAATVATVGGAGTTGEIAYQIADAAISRVIVTLGRGANGGGVTVPNPLGGAA